MEELTGIADLWVDLAAEQREYGSHLLAEENREGMRMAIAQGIHDDEVLVAKDGGELVGFIAFEIEHGAYRTSATRGVVRNVYVVPDERDAGIGGALFDAAESRLAAAGVDVVALEVMAGNDAARRFYRERGYDPHRIEYELPVTDRRS